VVTLTGSDADGDPLAYSIVAGPANGTLSGTAPNLTYTPGPNANGADSFTFKANDGTSDSNVATVSITVNAVNDTPVAVDESAATNEGVAVNIDVLINDTDGDGDALIVDSVTQGANGSVVINGDNTVTYTPNPGFAAVDTFTYTASDGTATSNTATVTVTVTPLAPQSLFGDGFESADFATGGWATNGNATVDTETPYSGTYTAKIKKVAWIEKAISTEGYGDIHVSYARWTKSFDSGEYLFVEWSSNGSDWIALEQTQDGTWAAQDMTCDSGADDQTGFRVRFRTNTNREEAYIDAVEISGTPLGPPNQSPTANDDGQTTDEDTPVVIDVLGNDSDPDGDPLGIDSVTQGSNGTVVINGDNTATYTPGADFNGVDSFSYTISDGRGAIDTATVAVTVAPVNDLPAASAQSVSTDQDTPLAITLTGDDGDPEVVQALTFMVDGGPSYGTLTGLNPSTGDVTYTPNAGYNGPDSFTFAVTDDGTAGDPAGLISSPTTVSITVYRVNNGPIAVDDTVPTNEDTPVTIDVLANDSDPDQDPLTVDSVTQGTNGSVAIDGNNMVTYTPSADFNGSDSFSYTVDDGFGGTATATVSVTINGVNDPPTITSTPVTTATQDEPYTYDVDASDVDAGDPLKFSLDVAPNGMTINSTSGLIEWTPTNAQVGPNGVTVRVEDAGGLSDTQSFAITVSGASATRFFVVDTGVDDTFEYDALGTPLANYDLAPGNTDPRGATSNADGSTVWVIDKNKTVYVYDTTTGFQGSWTAEGLNSPEGIATDGTSIWIVDGRAKRVFEYSSAAGFTSGSHASSSDFALDGSNGKAKGITTDGESIWVVDDNKTDRVFKYDVASGSLAGSWVIDSANAKPAGITIDPSNVGDIWIVDDGTDEVFQYTAAASLTSGAQAADIVFSLAAGNTNPTGIADPPPVGVDEIFASHQAAVDLFPRGLDAELFLTTAQEKREERAIDAVLLYLDADPLDD